MLIHLFDQISVHIYDIKYFLFPFLLFFFQGHKGNIRLLKYNRVYNTLLSVTWLGVIEYWVPEEQYKFGQNWCVCLYVLFF